MKLGRLTVLPALSLILTAATPLERAVEHKTPEPKSATAVLDTVVVDSWTFDGIGGVPDPQGWTVHDRSADLQAFFHAADATELDGGDFGYLNVLEGSQSLWCGATYATHPEMCHYATLPGYGQDWDQAWVSRTFQTDGGAGIGFIISYDTEPGYDTIDLYYRDADWDWAGMGQYSFEGVLREAISVPDTSLDSTQFMIRFRDRFVGNDEFFSFPDLDSDGAVILDSITVWDGSGVLDFEDFEDEAPGALATTDGDWQALNVGLYGITGALFDGSTVLQEDPLVSNTTNLWAFFSGSTFNYSCEGHPGQAVVPYQRADAILGPGFERYLHNEIWSPVVDFTVDENSNPISSEYDQAFLEFDVYRDLELGRLVFYTWAVREVIDGCPQAWQSDEQAYYGSTPVWFRAQFDLGEYISPAAEEIQVALGVIDMCPQWCGVFGFIDCHSHAPLFDNVRVVRAGDIVSSAGDTPALTALGEAYPNPFNPSTTIPFALAADGPVRVEVYDVAGRLVRTLVDRNMNASPSHRVDWDGLDAAGNSSASGVYFVRMTAGSFKESRKITLLK